MATNFIAQLNEITEVAQHYIAERAAQQKVIIIFSATDDDDEWTKDIYDEVPDFPFYSKHGFVGYVAVKEIHLQDHGIVITGILKGDGYPDQVRVLLTDLDAYSSASLADYLSDVHSIDPTLK